MWTWKPSSRPSAHTKFPVLSYLSQFLSDFAKWPLYTQRRKPSFNNTMLLLHWIHRPKCTCAWKSIMAQKMKFSHACDTQAEARFGFPVCQGLRTVKWQRGEGNQQLSCVMTLFIVLQCKEMAFILVAEFIFPLSSWKEKLSSTLLLCSPNEGTLLLNITLVNSIPKTKFSNSQYVWNWERLTSACITTPHNTSALSPWQNLCWSRLEQTPAMLLQRLS